MFIRPVRPDDAEQLLRLQLQLDQETQFMLFEPGERKTTVEEKRAQIKLVLSEDVSIIFIAEHEGLLVGYLMATGYTRKRIQHAMTLVIGILQAFIGQGIGTQLFVAMEEWARQRHLHRLELTVMTNNVAGIALYKKRGFEIEGTRRHAYVVDGQYVDEYHMAKLLD